MPAGGRWFLYFELARGGQPIESWVPIKVGEGTASVAEPQRYAYRPSRSQTTTIQVLSAAIMYLLAPALLGAVARLITRSRAPA